MPNVLKIDEKAGTFTLTGRLAPRPSKSGKTTVIAGTSGAEVMATMYKGQPIKANFSLYVPRNDTDTNGGETDPE